MIQATNPPALRAVIFDIGGVLIRTQDFAPRQQMEERLGLAPGQAEYIVYNSDAGLRTQRGEFSEEQNWRRVQRDLALTDEQLADFRANFWAGDRLDQDLIAYIRRLRPRYQTAIISNAMPGLMTMLTGKHPIADAFDVIVGSGDVGMMKPDPAIYHLALEKLGRKPAEAVFIDDFVHNVEGARAVGINAVLYTPGLDVPAALEELGVRVSE